MKYLVIGNPEAGKKALDGTLERVRSAFEARKIIYEIRLTQFPGHAAKIAAEGLSEGFTHMISLGGDGTSSEIVSSVLGTETVLGIIPEGSGNDFSKAAGIPLDTQAALDNVFSGRPRKADVAFVDEKCFINGFGVGMDGAVAHDFGDLGLRRFGSFGYVVGAVIEAVCLQGGRGSWCGGRDRQETASFRGLERSFSGREVQPGSPGGHIRRVSRYPYNK